MAKVSQTQGTGPYQSKKVLDDALIAIMQRDKSLTSPAKKKKRSRSNRVHVIKHVVKVADPFNSHNFENMLSKAYKGKKD